MLFSVILIFFALGSAVIRWAYLRYKIRAYIGANYPLLWNELKLGEPTGESGFPQNGEFAWWLSTKQYSMLGDDKLSRICSSYMASRFWALGSLVIIVVGVILLANAS